MVKARWKRGRGSVIGICLKSISYSLCMIVNSFAHLEAFLTFEYLRSWLNIGLEGATNSSSKATLAYR